MKFVTDRGIHTPNPLRGTVAGLAAGLAGAVAMTVFQAIAQRVAPSGESGGEPATVKAAQAVSTTLTGAPLPHGREGIAGGAVHYLTGAALGIAYGLAAEYRPDVARGGGSLFGSTVAALLDEGAVPALGLSAGPSQVPASTHLFGFSSHAVFGAAAEAVRRLIVEAWPAR